MIDEHHDICAADLSVAQFSRHIFRNVDWVVHLVHAIAAERKLGDHQSRLFRDDVLINSNIIRAASHYNTSKFVYVRTARIFPRGMQDLGTVNDPAALVESHNFPPNLESPCDWSKLVGEYELLLLKGHIAALQCIRPGC